jgi:hypothetical protein
MLTLMMALATPAQAQDVKKVETFHWGGLDWKSCTAAHPDTYFWWDSVLYNVSTESRGPSYSTRSAGNCFDVDAVTSDPEGQEKLADLAYGYAAKKSAKFYQVSSTTEHIILSSESHEPSDYHPPVAIPVGPGLIDILDPMTGMHMATMETGGGDVNHIATGDYDGNGLTDFLFVMENGDLYEAMNVPPGAFIHNFGQVVYYQY